MIKLMCYALGLLRSIGRFSADYDTPLISLIFPLPVDETKKCKGAGGADMLVFDGIFGKKMKKMMKN